jgi:hypothetical protein
MKSSTSKSGTGLADSRRWRAWVPLVIAAGLLSGGAAALVADALPVLAVALAVASVAVFASAAYPHRVGGPDRPDHMPGRCAGRERRRFAVPLR